MDSVAKRLPDGQRRGAQAKRQRAEAYCAVFAGKGTPVQAQIVLADLANVSGFFKVLEAPASADERAFHEGKRALFGRIYADLRMSEAELFALQEAARVEALTDADEGSY